MTGKYCNRKLIKLMQTEIISNVYFVPVWAKHDAVISSFDSDLLEKTVFCVYVIDVLLFYAEMGEGLCSTHPNLLPAIISINIFFFPSILSCARFLVFFNRVHLHDLVRLKNWNHHFKSNSLQQCGIPFCLQSPHVFGFN